MFIVLYGLFQWGRVNTAMVWGPGLGDSSLRYRKIQADTRAGRVMENVRR